jgi:hypothetical protein
MEAHEIGLSGDREGYFSTKLSTGGPASAAVKSL